MLAPLMNSSQIELTFSAVYDRSHSLLVGIGTTDLQCLDVSPTHTKRNPELVSDISKLVNASGERDQVVGHIWSESISHETTLPYGLDRASLPHHVSSGFPPISVLSFKHNHNDIHNQQHFSPNNFGSLFCFPTGVREIHCIETKGNKKGWAGHSILCRMKRNGNRLMVFFWLLCHLLPRLNAQLQKEIPTSIDIFCASSSG